MNSITSDNVLGLNIR